MYAYSTESCIHLFRNQPASVQRQSPDRKSEISPRFCRAFFHGGEEGAIILQGLNEWMDVIDSFLIYSYQIAKKTSFL